MKNQQAEGHGNGNAPNKSSRTGKPLDGSVFVPSFPASAWAGSARQRRRRASYRLLERERGAAAAPACLYPVRALLYSDKSRPALFHNAAPPPPPPRRRRQRRAAGWRGHFVFFFGTGTLAAASLSAFIIMCHSSPAIYSDLGKWF